MNMNDGESACLVKSRTHIISRLTSENDTRIDESKARCSCVLMQLLECSLVFIEDGTLLPEVCYVVITWRDRGPHREQAGQVVLGFQEHPETQIRACTIQVAVYGKSSRQTRIFEAEGRRSSLEVEAKHARVLNLPILRNSLSPLV